MTLECRAIVGRGAHHVVARDDATTFFQIVRIAAEERVVFEEEKVRCPELGSGVPLRSAIGHSVYADAIVHGRAGAENIVVCDSVDAENEGGGGILHAVEI